VRPTNGAAIDPRRLDRHEHHPIQGGVAPLHGFIVSDGIEHAETILGMQPRRELDAVITSENGR